MQEQEKNLYVIRGCSGSGKTTFAETLVEALDPDWTESMLIGADDYPGYYQNRKREYHFTPQIYREAHAWMRNALSAAINWSYPNIVVHEVFSKEHELEPILNYAKQSGYRITVLVVENRHGNADVHGVPQDKLREQEAGIRKTLRLLP